MTSTDHTKEMDNSYASAQLIAAPKTETAPATTSSASPIKMENKIATKSTPPASKKRTTFLSLPAEIRQQIIKGSFTMHLGNPAFKRKAEMLRSARTCVGAWAAILKEVEEDSAFEADVDFVARELMDTILEVALESLEGHEKKNVGVDQWSVGSTGAWSGLGCF
ncbi:hypothetical protein EG328_004176 [Venturia inaequalis]|nr:hypothetical protein EG328_004176 [Venturia inaequalis]